MSRSFGSMDVNEPFVRKIEAANGNCCIYKKIKPIRLDIWRNAVRCLKNMSEFVYFANDEAVARIVI